MFVCPSCGFLSSERLLFCARCGKRLHTDEESRAIADPVREKKRVRILYGWLAGWILLLVGAVLYAVAYDPTAGHAGSVVYNDEFILEQAGRDAGIRLLPGNQTFRISKNDRVEKMDLATRSPKNVWIRITSGPHAGRSGVIVW